MGLILTLRACASLLFWKLKSQYWTTYIVYFCSVCLKTSIDLLCFVILPDICCRIIEASFSLALMSRDPGHHSSTREFRQMYICTKEELRVKYNTGNCFVDVSKPHIYFSFLPLFSPLISVLLHPTPPPPPTHPSLPPTQPNPQHISVALLYLSF